MKQYCKYYRSFTLIELLFVIAVIMMLVAMLLPVLRNAKEQCKKIYCSNNLKQIGNSIVMYSMDYDGYPPTGPFWISPLASYIGLPSVLTGDVSEASILACPSYTKEVSSAYLKYSYAINNYLPYNTTGWIKFNPKLGQIKTPGAKIMYLENRGVYTSIDSSTLESEPRFRHTQHMNILWMDCHISIGKELTLEMLYPLK